MPRRIVASLHGANGVVIATLEQQIGGSGLIKINPSESANSPFSSAFNELCFWVDVQWKHSIEGGCRVVIGIPDDGAK